MPRRCVRAFSPEDVVQRGNAFLDHLVAAAAERVERQRLVRMLFRAAVVLLGSAAIGVGVASVGVGAYLNSLSLGLVIPGIIAVAAGLFGPASGGRLVPTVPVALAFLSVLGVMHERATHDGVLAITVVYHLLILGPPYLVLRYGLPHFSPRRVVAVAVLVVGVSWFLIRQVATLGFAPTWDVAISLGINPMGVLLLAVVVASFAELDPAQGRQWAGRLWEPAVLYHIFPFFSVAEAKRPYLELVRGTKSLALGIAAIAGAVLLAAHLPPPTSMRAPIDYLRHGFLSYLWYFGVSFGAAELFVASFRLSGRTMDDFFNWPLLAASPAAKWRTWNTSVYEWTRLFVFTPLMRRTGLLGLSIVASFMVSFAFHVDRVTLQYLVRGDAPPALFGFLADTLVFFVLQGVAVWLSIRLHRFWPAANSRKGWIGVAMTWLLMILIHIFRIY